MKEELIKVLFELNEDWHGCSTETLWAEKVGEDQYRLDNTPFYVKGVSFGDIITAKEKQGFLKYESVLKRGGHSTYRIIIDHAKVPINKFQNYWKHFSELACTYEGGPEFRSKDKNLKIYAIDVHPEVKLDQVYAKLQKGEHEGIWEFEEGHCYEKNENRNNS